MKLCHPSDVIAKLISCCPYLENVSITANRIDLGNQPLDEVSKLKHLKKLSVLSDLTGPATVFNKVCNYKNVIQIVKYNEMSDRS